MPLVAAGVPVLAAVTKGLAGFGAKAAAKVGMTAAAKALLKKKLAAAAAQKMAQGAVAGGAKRTAGSRLFDLAAAAGKRAGYTRNELLWNVVPDVAMNAMYIGQIPGDPVDKALAIGSNIVVGQGLAGMGRAAVGMGRTRRMLDKINAQKTAALANGTKLDPRILALESKLQPRMNLGQGMEVAGMMAGGPLGYDLGENLQRGKSYIGGQGYLSPTDRMFVEQDEQTQLQMLEAYQAGLAAGGQKGYYSDPYTGDVPLGGVYGY